MTDISNNVGEKPTEDFNALSFERKLVELVEELRLRRNLEVESEKTLKSVMDEKYQEELSWDEQIRRHGREREDFAQQIDLLKRKLEDKFCVSDEDKAKQQIMNKTYSHEIRILKEELRVSKSEKLNLQKKIQELEIKLKLHDNFQESILNQVSEVRKMMKAIFEENKELMGSQKKMMENVASAKYMFKKYDLCNQHLTQCIEVIGKKNESLKNKLISSWSENTLLKQSVPTAKEKNSNCLEVEKWQKKVLDLENLLLTSRKENENTLSNFLESNKLLCKFVDKFSEIEEREKQLTVELELLQNKSRATQDELQKTKDVIKEIEEKTALKEKKRIENQCSTGIQTESVLDYSCSCSETFVKSSDNEVTTTLASFIPKEMDKNFMDEFRNGLVNLQQNALMMQSEMSVNNGIHSFSLDQLCVNSSDKKITLSQVLKRKLEIMESGDPIDKIMKKRFTENTSQSVIVVDNGLERDIKNEMMISHEPNSVSLCGKFNQDVLHLSSSDKSKMLISHEPNGLPLCGNFNQDIPYLSSSVKPKMLIPHEPNSVPLYGKFNQDIPHPSSSVKPKMSISHEPNGLPLCGKFNQDIPYLASSVKPKMLLSYESKGQSLNPDVSVYPPSVDIHLDQRYLTYKKFPGKVNEDNDDYN